LQLQRAKLQLNLVNTWSHSGLEVDEGEELSAMENQATKYYPLCVKTVLSEELSGKNY
jgi:hypothetical protein